EIKEKYTLWQFVDKAENSVTKNIPKFLFFYMPVFAFFMWLFHNKKKWYYFDHGIFTLHYFSFLLLSFFTIISVLGTIGEKVHHWLISAFYMLSSVVVLLWTFIYFFKAHRKVYGYSIINTLFRGLFLFFLNMIFLLFGIIVYMFFIFYLM